MMRLRILTFAAAVAVTLPAAAQKSSSTVSALPSLSGIGRTASPRVQRPSMAFPVIDYGAPDSSSPMPRGIIAGRQIAPGTVLGLGIFQTTPKMQGYVGDVPQNMAPRRSKRAAVGLSVKF
jgi:hypothetical protein